MKPSPIDSTPTIESSQTRPIYVSNFQGIILLVNDTAILYTASSKEEA
jgi:hypothetical protein